LDAKLHGNDPKAGLMSRVRRFILVGLLVSLAGCVNVLPFFPPATSTPTAPPEQITVAAAADLQFAFTEIAALFEDDTGVKVNLVFGSTGQLTQQIENGAPYDLTAAANQAYIDRLAAQDLVLPESVALYAQGHIVLAVNRQPGHKALGLQDLMQPEITRVAIANPEHAPYGVAAMQALQTAGLWEQIQPKLVLAENVRQALQYIQSGDAEAGIIALSVADVPEIEWTLIDDEFHAPLNQALAVVTSSTHPDLAANFAAYINGEKGRPIMRRYGFILPGEEPLRPHDLQP
jgi:molybdate transport system substrate-binding protein